MADVYQSAGEKLGSAERSIGTPMRTILANYNQANDLSTAQAIRQARTDTEAAEMVAAMRRGRATEVLMIASSAALGVASGALLQKALDNPTPKGVPIGGIGGLVPTVAGLAFDVSLALRASMAVGGVSHMMGAALYAAVAPKQETTP
jgi:hypothetical protein